MQVSYTLDIAEVSCDEDFAVTTQRALCLRYRLRYANVAHL